MMELYLRSPISLHVVMLNKFSTGITLPLPFVAKHWWCRKIDHKTRTFPINEFYGFPTFHVLLVSYVLLLHLWFLKIIADTVDHTNLDCIRHTKIIFKTIFLS